MSSWETISGISPIYEIVHAELVQGEEGGKGGGVEDRTGELSD